MNDLSHGAGKWLYIYRRSEYNVLGRRPEEAPMPYKRVREQGIVFHLKDD